MRATAGAPRTFLDTNIFVYADDEDSPEKQRQAREIIYQQRRLGSGVVSTQVLQEYFVNATQKLKLDPGTARRKVELLSDFQVAVPGPPEILAAIDLHRLHRLSFWDALILHLARQAGCRILLSEDMQHLQVFAGLQILNPFL